MPIDQIIMGIAAFLLVSAILTFIISRILKSTWTGQLIEKKVLQGNDESPDNYKLIFQTDNGKKKSILVDEKTYNNMKVGDKVEKKSGQMLPQVRKN